MTGRTVTLVAVSTDGAPLGRLPTFTVETPWWQDLEPVLARRPDVVVLRLLDATVDGRVRYLVEADTPPADLAPWDDADADALADHPLRMPWARPGGPAADLSWAAAVVQPTGPPQQIRSWNLSSIWRLPTADGPVWLKHVPPFFAHEPEVLHLLAPHPGAPELLASDGGRMLLADLPGRDGYDASPAERRAGVDVLVELQQHLPAGRLAGGAVPDWRVGPFRDMAEDVVRRRGGERAGLRALLDGWDDRFAAVDECGLTDTLFHGDPHAGNTRIGVEPPVLFDWGDSGLGHPLLDLVVADDDPALVDHWLGRWAAAVPGSDPHRAWALLRPFAVLRGAVVFQRFLDAIEPSERAYHEHDVEPFLERAAGLASQP